MLNLQEPRFRCSYHCEPPNGPQAMTVDSAPVLLVAARLRKVRSFGTTQMVHNRAGTMG